MGVGVDVAELDAPWEEPFGAAFADGPTAAAPAVVGGDGVCECTTAVVAVAGTVGVVVVAAAGGAAAAPQSDPFKGLGA